VKPPGALAGLFAPFTAVHVIGFHQTAHAVKHGYGVENRD
jgi:hypothetical protein